MHSVVTLTRDRIISKYWAEDGPSVRYSKRTCESDPTIVIRGTKVHFPKSRFSSAGFSSETASHASFPIFGERALCSTVFFFLFFL